MENWCREFQKFAGDNINVETYYADKADRPRLREMLNSTVVTKKPGGWNVLITTYNLAQGDDHDRKFFRKIEWDVSVDIVLCEHDMNLGRRPASSTRVTS